MDPLAKRPRLLIAFGGAMLAAAVALSIATLTTAPALFGDEAWYASTAWSAASGHGLEPSLASGGGVYDAVPDFWASRVASLPSVAAEAMFPTSLALHRGLVLATSLLALLVFGLAMRRLYGTGIALLSCSALAMTFGFYSASHWVRWDGMAILFTSTVLLLLVRSPRPLAAAGIGLMIGIAPDFALAICGALPGVLVLCTWEREQRLLRIGALAGGVAIGGLMFALLHFTGGWSDAQHQYDVVYEPIYGRIPIFAALGEHSLSPLLAESDRYAQMAYEPFTGNFAVLSVGALAMCIVLARELGAGLRALAPAALVGVLFIGWALLRSQTPYDPLRYLMGVLIVVGFVAMLVLGIRALFHSRPYPGEAVSAFLLASMLVGYGLLLGYKGGTYVTFCFPFAVGAIVAALRALAPAQLTTVVPVAGLVAGTLVATLFLVDQIRAVDSEPALDADLGATARQIVPEGDTVVGEWIYWWLYRDDRFRFNSDIWLQRWQHPSDSFADSFHRVCPDYVLLDDLWLQRYRQVALGRRFASQAPTEYGEKRKLLRLLNNEYRPVRQVRLDGRKLVFWHRSASACSPA